MLRFSTLLALSLLPLAQTKDDFRTFDYCRLETTPTCRRHAHPDWGGHPACNCTALPNREVVLAEGTEHMKAFRQGILDLHNYWRNQVALGREKRPYAPEASDMMMVRWDFELEYIAKCRLLNSFASFKDFLKHETCRFTAKHELYGQNMYGQGFMNSSFGIVRTAFQIWTEEVQNIEPTTIDSFQVTKTGLRVERFTQVVWSTVTHIGCALVRNRTPLHKIHTLVVLCNYKSMLVPYGGNLVNKPVYLRGKSCTACPYHAPCESRRFTGLCGQEISVLDYDDEGEVDIVRGPIGVCTSERNVLDWVLVAACLCAGKLGLDVF